MRLLTVSLLPYTKGWGLCINVEERGIELAVHIIPVIMFLEKQLYMSQLFQKQMNV